MGAKGDSSAGARSRRKGVSFERRMANAITDWLGVACRRTPMSGAYGGEWNLGGDLMLERESPLYFELKNDERWMLEQLFKEPRTGPVQGWFEKALKEAALNGQEPVVIMTRNNVPVFVWVRVLGAVRTCFSSFPPHEPYIVVGEWIGMSWERFTSQVSAEAIWRLSVQASPLASAPELEF